jgi:hypothetical protein
MEEMRANLDWEEGWITFVQILGTVLLAALAFYFILPAITSAFGGGSLMKV